MQNKGNTYIFILQKKNITSDKKKLGFRILTIISQK